MDRLSACPEVPPIFQQHYSKTLHYIRQEVKLMHIEGELAYTNKFRNILSTDSHLNNKTNFPIGFTASIIFKQFMDNKSFVK